MRINSIGYSVGEAVQNLLKNRLMSVASIVTVAACILMMGVSYCLAVNIDYNLSKLERTLKVIVYIGDDATTEQVNGLMGMLNGTAHVKKARYISAQEALETAQQDWGDANGILKGFENDNPLPRSFELDVDDIKNIESVVAALAALNNPAIELIKHGRDVASTLMTVNNFIRVISLFIIAGLGVISVVIITNTIRLAVNTRRVEINIMKYVGATDWFIRWPFILEGVLIGVLGAVLPMVICWFGYDAVIQKLRTDLPAVSLEYLTGLSVFSVLAPLSVAMGVFIGCFGSVSSVRKHLNV